MVEVMKKKMENYVKEHKLPANLKYDFTGQMEEQAKQMAFLSKALREKLAMYWKTQSEKSTMSWKLASEKLAISPSSRLRLMRRSVPLPYNRVIAGVAGKLSEISRDFLPPRGQEISY